MSAACVAAGMFKPIGNEAELPGVLESWDPVPIHSRPRDEDPYLSMLAPCPKWSENYANLKKTEVFNNLFEKHSNLTKFISNKTGWDVDDLEYFRYLQKVLYIYQEHNSYFIPSWIQSTSKGDKETIEHLAGLSFAMETYTEKLKRLSAGPFCHMLLEFLDNGVRKRNHLKFMILSGHDTTISGVLNTMGCFDNVSPEFSATVLWELYKQVSGNFIVRIFYLKSTLPVLKIEALKLKGCALDCDYGTFKTLISTYAVNRERWRKECHGSK